MNLIRNILARTNRCHIGGNPPPPGFPANSKRAWCETLVVINYPRLQEFRQIWRQLQSLMGIPRKPFPSEWRQVQTPSKPGLSSYWTTMVVKESWRSCSLSRLAQINREVAPLESLSMVSRHLRKLTYGNTLNSTKSYPWGHTVCGLYWSAQTNWEIAPHRNPLMFFRNFRFKKNSFQWLS